MKKMKPFAKIKDRLILGVTGGIASGKSTVSKMLERLGAPLIDMDLIARQVALPGAPVFNAIVDFLGTDVVGDDQGLDRKKISEIVFSNVEKRKHLERLTHPAILTESVRQATHLAQTDPGRVIQVAVPLLIESNMGDMFEKILLVHIPATLQIKRLSKRDGISEAAAANILTSQLPIDEKIKHADFVIDNRGSLEQTRKEVEKLWDILKQIRPKKKELNP